LHIHYGIYFWYQTALIYQTIRMHRTVNGRHFLAQLKSKAEVDSGSAKVKP